MTLETITVAVIVFITTSVGTSLCFLLPEYVRAGQKRTTFMPLDDER